jgi:hypothetical protein
MSVICENCRSEVPGDAAFCPDCGTARGPQVLCQIGYWRGYLWSEFVAFQNGETEVARSKGFRWRGSGEVPPKTAASGRRLKELGQQLVELGWRSEEATAGDPWYAWRFTGTGRSDGLLHPDVPEPEPDLDAEHLSRGAVEGPDVAESRQFEAPAAPMTVHDGLSPEPHWLGPILAAPPVTSPEPEVAAPAGLIVAAEAGALGRYLAGSEAREPASFEPVFEASPPGLDSFDPTFAATEAIASPTPAEFSVEAPGEDLAGPRLADAGVVSSARFTPEFERGEFGFDLGTRALATNGTAEHSPIAQEFESVPTPAGPWYQKPRTDPISVEVDSDLCVRVHAYTVS